MSEHRDVIAIGASAGGVEALRTLVGGLPVDYPGALLVVLHVPRDAPSALPAILNRSGPLPAALAVDGEPLHYGRIYVAPSDHHLICLDGLVRVTHGPSENGHRPAIDPLFRSVARAYRRRAIGVVLSGARDDGAAGLASIAASGGAAVVQDPLDALQGSMPSAALALVPDAHVAAAAKLGALIAGLTAADLPDEEAGEPGDETIANDAAHIWDAEVAMADLGPMTTDRLDVPPSGYGCPTCGGALFEITTERVPRYRCRIGHAWSPESLIEEQALALESALWMALRALEEKSALSRRMAVGPGMFRERYSDLAAGADAAGETIRGLIAKLGAAATLPDPGDAPTGTPAGLG
jgi:two-component system chemotaxis response regulator CheB